MSGVILYDPSTKEFRNFLQNNAEGLKYSGNRFRVLEDNNGFVWINMKGGGFGYYNTEKGAIEHFLTTPDAANFYLPNSVLTIYYDPAGILWLTTNERELVKVILQGDVFKQRLLAEKGVLRPENEVRGIFNDRKNRLWMGAKDGKLYVFQNGKSITSLFANKPEQGFGAIYSILQDRRGNIWIGTKGNGLYRASPVTADETAYYLTHFQANGADPDGLHCNEIYSLLEDHQGRIWIGSFDNGLTLVAESGDSVKFIQSGNAFRHYPKEGYRKIRHMALDGAGNIWIGTTFS